MEAEGMVKSTGVPGLDTMLRGGLPEERSVLLIGGPGTGKSTLAMQFLQEGLERDEECLFVSTEQTPGELRDSFEPFDFHLDHERLSVETIHATLGSTVESDGEEVVLDSLDDSYEAIQDGGVANRNFGPFTLPFTSNDIQEVLRPYSPCERVVFDSISGLEAMTGDNQLFRRCILDFIRLFTDEFGATTLFTAEEISGPQSNSRGPSEKLQFNTHGVIRLWREQIDGDFHRFARVEKMRGIDHATQSYEMELDTQGVSIVPEERSKSKGLNRFGTLGTGIGGLDRLCGGGLPAGGTTLLGHDGRANVNTIVANAIIESIREDHAIVLLPPSSLETEHLNELIAERVGAIGELLDDDRMFVLDLSGNWDDYSYNVFGIKDYERSLRQMFGGLNMLVSWKMKRIFKRMNERRGSRPALAVVYTEAMLQEFSPNEVRQLHQWAKKNLFVPKDTVLFVQNPDVMDKTLSEFFVLDAQQVIKTWIHGNGLQYIKLEKSPIGKLSSSKLVEHVDYPPYVRVQRSQGRET